MSTTSDQARILRAVVPVVKQLPAQVVSGLASSRGKKCISEFIGTYLLVFTIGCNFYSNVEINAANWNSTTIAFVLMASVYALSSVSGAHFNPAVSFAVAMSGKKKVGTCLMYSLVQIIAGVFAGFTYHLLFSRHGHPPLLLGPVQPYSWFETMIAEVLYTCMLCFVVLNVTVASKTKGNHYYGFAIGFVIIAGHHAAGGISGGIFNPAVAFGIELSSGSFSWSVLYLIYELIGAAIASGLFSYVRPDDHGAQPDLTGHFFYSLPEMCISEMIGTFYLCVTIGLCVMSSSPATPWAAGAALASMTFSVDTVSGAHFNPALTLAFCLQDKEHCTTMRAFTYIIVQTVASIGAAVMCKITHLDGSFGFGPGAHATFGWGPVMTTEIIYTFLLCFVALCVCNGQGCYPKPGWEEQRPRLKEIHGLAIGACVTASGFAVGAVSGAALNPAVSFGPTIVHLMHGGNLFNGLVFVVLELVASVVAVYAFKATHHTHSHYT